MLLARIVRRARVVSFLLAAVCGLLSAGLAVAQAPADAQAAERFFENKVRPLLAESCFKCHGPQAHKGGLRLDSRAAMLAGGDSGPALVPGDTAGSLLVQVLSYGDDYVQMPPSGKLPADKIADLTAWVKMGAPWPGADADPPVAKRREFSIREADRAHWSFQPVRRPVVPQVDDKTWSTSPIDAFILAGLRLRGLAHNPPADKAALIRRATYDLTGLPPTPEEVSAFVADTSPDAYERLVDRLLASPHYGEKWGRHWLDLVRYAETNSFERDNPKPNAWRYRDYVIQSFNNDKPFDQFIVEQLAGDELPQPTNDALIATGYYRLGIWDDEPADYEQARYDGLDDIVATTGQVFLGLTFDCARCHDHKIDPIAQKDYYGLLAFFQNIADYHNGGPTDEALIFQGPDERAAYERQVAALEQRRNDVQAELTAIEADYRALAEHARREGTTPADLDDLAYRFYRDTWDRLPDFDGLRPEQQGTLPDRLFDLGPRSRDVSIGFVFEGRLIVPAAGLYTFYLDSDDGSRLTVAGRQLIEYDGIHGTGNEKQARIELEPGRVPIRIDYFQKQHGLGLSVAWSGPGFDRRPLSTSGTSKPNKSKKDAKAAAPIDEALGPRLLGADRFTRYQALVRELKQLKEQTVPVAKALCVRERGPEAPDTFVLVRGNPHVQGEKVSAAFPAILGGGSPQLAEQGDGAATARRRIALARWMASESNPLTARVMANRLWQYHFGRGLVRSSSNFGLQGDKPTHPELLDWLASELVASGWKLKPLHRAIMLSQAYRMSSRSAAAALAEDPANDALWRFDMRRLTSEEIRDSILALNGTLNLKMYGPSIYPEIPPEALAGQSRPGAGWGKSSPEEQARRSVYIHAKRSLMTPLLERFDMAEPDRSAPVRFSTTQPTQALTMLNSTFVNQQAALFAARLRRENPSNARAQVARALYLATQREATAGEIERGCRLVEQLQHDHQASDDAALGLFCLVVLNLNEFVYLD